MRFKWSLFIYCVICSIPVCFCLCMTSSIINCSIIEGSKLIVDFDKLDWLSFATNYVLAFIMAIIIGMFVPFGIICPWFASLFHIKNETYKGNVPYRLIATLITAIIFYLGITPELALINFLYFKNLTWQQFWLNLLIAAPLMLIVGYVSTLINDLFAFKIAKNIEHKYRNKKESL